MSEPAWGGKGPAATTETFAATGGIETVLRPHGRLQIVHSAEPARVGEQVELRADVFAVGRDVDEAGLCLADPRLSRVHARFVFDPRAGALRIGDAHSKNGTFLNGARIETALLSNNDVIRVGDTLFVFGENPMDSLIEKVERVARSNLTVLLSGETGTGKELLARRIHALSERRGKFVALNCASLPPELLCSEFFGHTRYAFSGAQQGRPGLFQAADSGTLLLDEIAELPLDGQAALLRALQEKSVRPVGSETEIRVDVRVIAASHADIPERVTEGSFRTDLYARLAQVSLAVPPLRARKNEILGLASVIAKADDRELRLSADAAEALLCHDWPFNVRELESLVRAFTVISATDVLDTNYLKDREPALVQRIRPRPDPSAARAPKLPHSRQRAPTRAELESLLAAKAGNVALVAREMGKPRAQLYRWMKSFGLSAKRHRR